jgi:hypothetical protein
MVRKFMLVIGAVALAVSWTATAQAKPAAKPDKITFTSGWTETKFDVNGNVTSVRSGDKSQQPYAAQAAQIEDVATTGVSTPFAGVVTNSASGCASVDWYESGHSSLFGTLVYRFHQTKYWCWSYPSITTVSVGTYVSNVDSSEAYRGLVSSDGYFYNWSGSARGGHYSLRQGHFENCVIKYGCIGSSYPWTKIYVNGNGAWVGYDGGGA